MKPPYYAVIFTTTLTSPSEQYLRMAEAMEELAKQQPGYLGFESSRSEIGISVSYWEDLNAIAQWKANTEHKLAQELGIKEWYSWYKVRICKVEREYDFKKNPETE